MIGIDTNVLVRYIVQDDPKQSQKANHFIESARAAERPIFINGIVLCELVWVLETAYNYPKQAIVNVLEKILRTRQFSIHQPEIIWQALSSYHHAGADFADHYIARLNAYLECEHTVTFDKKAAKIKYFKHLS